MMNAPHPRRSLAVRISSRLSGAGHASPGAAALAIGAALAAGGSASAQWFVNQTTTRFPVQTEYTNQCTVVDLDNDGDLDIVWANGQGYSSAAPR
jgi:hypothetical protein